MKNCIYKKQTGRFSWKGHINIYIKFKDKCFIYFGKNVPLYVESVMFDESFWQQIFSRIEFFFRRAVVPK